MSEPDPISTHGRFVNAIRRCIYNRWFYAFLALVCLLDAAAELLDILEPGQNVTLDLISLVSSGLAAFLAAVVFLDLHLRRG